MSKKKPKSTPAPSPAPTPDVQAPGPAEFLYIVEALRPLAVPIEQLVPDPANALKHTERDIKATAASLRVYGQRQPIVVNKSNYVVLSGNGRLEAARLNGWTHIAAVFVEDDPATAAGYSIADNRTGRLAEWDKEALDSLLRSVQTEDEDLAGVFDDLAQDLGLVPKQETGGTPENVERKFQVIIECKDETHQLELLERFDQEGIEAKALTL